MGNDAKPRKPPRRTILNRKADGADDATKGPSFFTRISAGAAGGPAGNVAAETAMGAGRSRCFRKSSTEKNKNKKPKKANLSLEGGKMVALEGNGEGP